METHTISSSSHPQHDEKIQSYHRDGYLILRGLFSPKEAASFQKESERLINAEFVSPKNLRTPERLLDSGISFIERIDPVVDVSPLFHSVVYDDRIASVLEGVFGEPAKLFKDKLIFKAPGMSGYSMHQDYAYWQPQGEESPLPGIHPDKILSVMVAIDAADAENGAIELFPDAHRKLITPPGALRNMNAEEVELLDLSTGVLGETAPGDVIIFHSLTPHRSQINRSTRSRRQLYMTYNAASAGDVYAAQQEHYINYRIKPGTEKDGTFFR